jgi:hypothetical protein
MSRWYRVEFSAQVQDGSVLIGVDPKEVMENLARFFKFKSVEDLVVTEVGRGQQVRGFALPTPMKTYLAPGDDEVDLKVNDIPRQATDTKVVMIMMGKDIHPFTCLCGSMTFAKHWASPIYICTSCGTNYEREKEIHEHDSGR